MAAIVEKPLYGLIQVETTAISGAFSWVDQTQYMTSAFYAEGVNEVTVGVVGPQIGTFTASFKNISVVPSSGDYVRLRRNGTTEYAFTGYIQDVSQRIVFEPSVSYTTPVTITTITALDWVGLLTQVQVNGIDGRDSGGTALSAAHWMEDRARALNYQFDTSGATELIEVTTYGAGTLQLSCTDFSGTIADHLDLAARSTDSYWFGNHIIPTNATTGRDKMVTYRKWATNVATGKTFTDVAGSAGHLHYTEIDFESSSANVVNTLNITNRALVKPTWSGFTKIAGGNEQNVVNINDTRLVNGQMNDEMWISKNATSITAYGNRVMDIETNLDTPIFQLPTSIEMGNHIANPSLDYDDSGYSGSGGATPRARRRQPSFGSFVGQWALRGRVTAAAGNILLNYAGGESDGIPVTATQYYYFKCAAARDTTSRTDLTAQARITWYDDSEAVLSTSSGTAVNLTTANTWYQPFVLAQAPANAVRAQVSVQYVRSGAGNHTVGDMVWLDGLWMVRCDSAGTGLSGTTYFDGDSANTSSVCYMWLGEVGLSQSIVLSNYVDTLGTTLTTRFGTSSMRAKRIRWNAQEDLTAVTSLTVGNTISLVYKGTTTTYRIVGINGDISQERYMIDYYLWKV